MLRWLSDNALGTYLFTRWRGEPVGEDGLGNRYYRERGGRKGGARAEWRGERRWVIYAGTGEIEPSMVPPAWHNWLHKQLEHPPSERPLPVRRWEKPHAPNLSGTPQAYLPPGHELRGGRRDPAPGDYEAWRPD